MGYLGEFKISWRPLLATVIGIGTGSAIGHYTLSLFGPELIKEFGWSKADYALVGSLPIVTMLVTPLAGRFTDRFGPRLAATVGFVAMALGFLGFSLMSGNLWEFFAIWIVQHIFGVLSTSLVFARLVVERFERARGTALSVLMMGPPLSGAIMAPIIGHSIASDGWRAAFVLLAAISAVGGAICVTFMGRSKRQVDEAAQGTEKADTSLSRQELFGLVRRPTFLLLVGGMALINIPQVFASSQLKLIVLSHGITDSAATWMVSLYAIGVMIGRAIFGIALDRLRPNVVALFALSLPAIGFVILASTVVQIWILAAAVLVIGVAQGAEGDIGSFMISRHFELKNFSLVFGFVKAGLDGGGAIGALILSATLRLEDSYVPFLLLSAVTTVIGAACFFLSGPGQARPHAATVPVETEAN